MGKEFKILFEEKNDKIDLLFELIRENRLYARVFCMENRQFARHKIVLYEEDNGFALVQYLKTFKISRTNKLYTREVKQLSFIYKDKKFWFCNNIGAHKSVRPATIQDLSNFYGLNSPELIDLVVKRFPWIRFMVENKLVSIPLNYIINNKLYSLTDFLKFYFKLPLPVIKEIMSVYSEKNIGGYNINAIRKIWNHNKLFLTNIENLKRDFINNEFFEDSVRLAGILDKKINCSWSVRRLKEEHDKWSKEHREITYRINTRRTVPLNVHKNFVEFGKIYGYELLDTNVKLIDEGIKQNHCVASYINKVNNGWCGIYHIEGYTLELNSTVTGLYISQFKGLGNVTAPDRLFEKVGLDVSKFNEIRKGKFEMGIGLPF
jgi:hypothetical protein